MTNENTNTAADAALARKLARRECNAKFAVVEKIREEMLAINAANDALQARRYCTTGVRLTDADAETLNQDLQTCEARGAASVDAWRPANRAWLVAVAAYCSADYEYTAALFEVAKSEIRANDNEDTRKAYGKAIRAKRAAVNREYKAKRAAAAK